MGRHRIEIEFDAESAEDAQMIYRRIRRSALSQIDRGWISDVAVSLTPVVPTNT